MNTDALWAKLGPGQDASLSYEELGYEPSEDLKELNYIIATARAMGFGTTNNISDRRIQFWKREEKSTGRK